ncbi:MAG: FAD-dependent oxidoreductase [Nitrospirae bacterium]|nr:FAD-dependent oxidoreductase [Nitrospirota bacterium]
MSSFDYDIGILGGGSAGLTVAAGAARFGARTLLIDREARLGGDCLHYGCVPSKTLIKTARVYHLMKNAPKFGLPGHEIRPVDFRDVSDRIRSVIAAIQGHDSVERFCGLGVKVEFGNAVFRDEHTVSLNGREISAKNWVIATGSSPAVPELEGLDRTPFLTNRDIFYLDRLPRSMIVIGAGPISTEMAQAFRRLGSDVTVIQRSGRILGREDADMADAVMRVLIAEGVRYHLDTSLLSIKDLGHERELTVRNKDGTVGVIRAEAVLVAVGRKPNLGGLGLENAGVEYDRSGPRLDNRLRTTQKHIFAAGDVTGRYQFTHAAEYEGGVVLANAVLHLPRKADYRLFPWCTYTDPELANIGMNETAALGAGLKYVAWTEEFRMNDRALAEGEGTGLIKLLLDERERPLGVQILGPRAGELIGEWVAALNGGVRLSVLARAVHPYPTLAEINRRVVGNYFSGRIFSEKVKKTLKFFFNLRGRACEGRQPPSGS